MENEKLVLKPVTITEWPDMQTLFTTTPSWGCWCMYWRGKRSDFRQAMGEGNRLAMQSIIESGKVPGLLAYREGKPVAWVSISPRQDLDTLERSRTLKHVDDQPVWSIVCFLVAKSERRKGMMTELITGAVSYAVKNGARIVEAYPLIPEESRDIHSSGYMGMLSTFKKLGFQEVARASRMRMIVRLTIPETEEEK